MNFKKKKVLLAPFTAKFTDGLLTGMAVTRGRFLLLCILCDDDKLKSAGPLAEASLAGHGDGTCRLQGYCAEKY